MASEPSTLPDDSPPEEAAVPDRVRPGVGVEPGRRLGRAVAYYALAATFRGLQPTTRERFTRDPARPWLDRVFYATDDGWEAPLYRLPVRAGASAEPVILAHGLGVNRHSLDYAEGMSLAGALAAAGFAVYLMEHRADRSACPPPDARPFDFDDIASQDLPAALDRVREHSGFERVLYVGHGLGGQLLYAHHALGGDEVAAACTLSAPVQFERPRSMASALRVARLLLPRGLSLPTRATAALMAPSARSGGGLASMALPGEVARGLLLHGTEDLPGGLLAQVLLWQELGHLSDRSGRFDYTAALRGLKAPLLVVASPSDPLCRPSQADIPGLEHERVLLPEGWGHLDALLSAEAKDNVYPRVVGFLDQHRARCW